MRKRIGWWILAAAALLTPFSAPTRAYAQHYEVPPVIFTGPLSHPRYEDGGFYIGMEALMYWQTRPIRNQTVAIRGFVDTDGTATGAAPPIFVGSGVEALNTRDLRGPSTWQPGWNFTLGWRFESGVAVQLSWIHLSESRYAVSAGPIPPGFDVGPLLENTFLFAPVTNFSPLYSGPRDLPQSTPPDPLLDPSPSALYGIWNGADNMSIEFLQRYEQVDITGRIPIWQTECFRSYGLIGPRAIIMWERFKWRTVDLDFQGIGTNANNATYSNVVSNRLYGVFLGGGHEWYLGSSPIGGFSTSLDAGVGLYGDWAKGRAKYERDDHATAAQRKRNFFRPAGSLEAKGSLWWYPWEAIQVRIGYNFMALFNTLASPEPIDFNMGIIDPEFRGVSRYLHGFDVGIGFVF
jgi:hypothetical protein